MHPRVLLLDEPFAALDLKLRQALQDEMRALHARLGGTFVFVTHDQTEAMALANRIVVMNAGRIEQIGSAEDIYLRPATKFVAGFVGEANFLPAERTGNLARVGDLLSVASQGPDGPVEVMLRPQRIALGAGAASCDYQAEAEVTGRMFLGAQVEYALRIGPHRLVAHSGDPGLVPGSRVRVGWNTADQWVVAS